jgi:Raf kinase inhibitor-like YbhB/YbcL family protein
MKLSPILLIGILAVGCSPPPPKVGEGGVTPPQVVDSGSPPANAGQLAVTSPNFQSGQPIPPGQNPPTIQWSGVPSGTKTIALEVLDPDAYNFVHWSVANMPATATSVAGGVSGENGSGAQGYYPPEPPPGTPHHYHFTVYALDTTLSLQPGYKHEDFQTAIKGHILAQAELMGTFQVNQ